MSSESATDLRPALTRLSDDEVAFRDAVAGFTTDEVKPRVQEMERAGRIDPAAACPPRFANGVAMDAG